MHIDTNRPCRTYRATFQVSETAEYKAWLKTQNLGPREYFLKRFRGPRPVTMVTTWDGRIVSRRNRQSMCLAKDATSFDVYVYQRWH